MIFFISQFLQIMFPSFKSESYREYRSSVDQTELLNSVIQFHPFTHCIEILTNNPSPPKLELSKPKQFFHVLLDMKALKDQELVDDLFSPSTHFVSLSPISNGNGMFVQKSTITFVLNDATYKRFGLSGKKVGGHHLIIISADKKNDLQKIRPCQPIEGLLFSENPEIYQPFLKKYEAADFLVDDWKESQNLDFDVHLLEKPTEATSENASEPPLEHSMELPNDWLKDFMKAIDKSLLNRSNVIIYSDVKRITIEGIMNLADFKDWICSIGENGWVLLQVWDMKDIPGSFVGKKKGMQGCGGGCDIVLFGKNLSRAHRIQTIEFVDEE
ncbi:hypothetical protein TRFO_02524 [Tritrichomonas foetus]|uniref:Uncharacterized protein n=1 Tax=Tritrichomonas foetus TaxID=1144522 RepID=A0A1J4L1U8_9EUKA|nr:hypothetical protein TRFO_02524 [Tritrichomonas foetus]|eukprot:OHT17495.1 hypothetical protein TRFO_02524 [Tritrichomonas foetus]